MSGLSLDFLKNLQIQEVTPSAPRVSRKELNPAPDFIGIRIWKDGSVYPSAKLVADFNLEYPQAKVEYIKVLGEDGQPKMIEVEGQGPVPETKRRVTPADGSNGLDVFFMPDWTQADATSRQNKLILVGVSPKNAGKVELFSQVNYNEDGTPKVSVMEQGAKTFGADRLLPLIEEAYGVKLSDETPFVDLEINLQYNLRQICPQGIFMLPKRISRGADAGKMDYVRRENIDIYPMVPVVKEEVTSDSNLLQECDPSADAPDQQEDLVSQAELA